MHPSYCAISYQNKYTTIKLLDGIIYLFGETIIDQICFDTRQQIRRQLVRTRRGGLNEQFSD